jgi:hypothetical protein|tara:strand:- start:1184 stop:1327 length:144 start_codon:yes stop_codon:yes gene_type:complete
VNSPGVSTFDRALRVERLMHHAEARREVNAEGYAKRAWVVDEDYHFV